VNRLADFVLARKLVASGVRAGAAMLADPATELKSLAVG
jgi:hypothetical protein